MKRRVYKIGLLLLALLVGGAIINVAVAWGLFVLYPITEMSERINKGEAYQVWTQAMPTGCTPQMEMNYGGGSTVGYRWVGVAGSCECSHQPGHIFEFQAGYPLWSLWGQRWSWDNEDRSAVGLIQITQSRGLSQGADGAVPCRPIWPGFAINTIFFAAVLWMLFAVPGAVRRRVRIKRGQCTTCGYSLRECVSDKCPECGAATCMTTVD